jgi:regulator of sirC expression with transglutaminase-like and TPR domain
MVSKPHRPANGRAWDAAAHGAIGRESLAADGVYGNDRSMDATRPAYCRPAAYRAFAAALPDAESPQGLFRAAWAIARHELPEADVASGEAVVARLAGAVRRRVRSQSPKALLAHLHDLLFDVLGFRGNTEDYYQPANSYLPEVLRTRRGLPITLTLVYRRVAAELGLAVHGVNSPGHFLAEVEAEEAGGLRSMYVDPFFGGGLLTAEEVFERISQATGRDVEPAREHLRRATASQWLMRILHNLQAVFAATGRERDVLAMEELQALL